MSDRSPPPSANPAGSRPASTMVGGVAGVGAHDEVVGARAVSGQDVGQRDLLDAVEHRLGVQVAPYGRRQQEQREEHGGEEEDPSQLGAMGEEPPLRSAGRANGSRGTGRLTWARRGGGGRAGSGPAARRRAGREHAGAGPRPVSGRGAGTRRGSTSTVRFRGGDVDLAGVAAGGSIAHWGATLNGGAPSAVEHLAGGRPRRRVSAGLLEEPGQERPHLGHRRRTVHLDGPVGCGGGLGRHLVAQGCHRGRQEP